MRFEAGLSKEEQKNTSSLKVEVKIKGQVVYEIWQGNVPIKNA
jgi:hypothetical protein